MHLAQETMSSTASNYNLPRLFIGTGIAFLICVLSFFTLPSFRPVTPAGIYFGLSLALYAVLMFASSYVEEEHNFWYWATSGWFFCLFLQNMRKEWYSQWIFHPAIMALAVHRIIRRWNQTGQKYAGADDIVNSGLFHGRYSAILWIFIGVTYMDLTIRLARHVARSVATFDSDQKARAVELESTDQHRLLGTIAVSPLCGTAFVFKLAFTAKDAPEMTSGINADLMSKIETLELVGLARMVFGGILLSGFWITIAEWTRSNRRKARGRQSNGGMSTIHLTPISFPFAEKYSLTDNNPFRSRRRLLRPNNPLPPHPNKSRKHPSLLPLPPPKPLPLYVFPLAPPPKKPPSKKEN